MRIPKIIKMVSVDSNGLLLEHEGRYFRAYTAEQQKDFVDPIIKSGLIDELVKKGLLVPTWVTDDEVDGYSLVLEHKSLAPTVFPYEWSFSMVKDAALVYLELAEIALRYGYYLKDCHPFNIVFHEGRPVWVDFGSFEKCSHEFSGFFAIPEFIKQYYYPLMLWSRSSEFLGRSVYGIMSSYQYLNFAAYFRICHCWSRLMPNIMVEKFGRMTEMYYNLYGISQKGIELRKKSSLINFLAKLVKKFIIPSSDRQFRHWRDKINSLSLPARSTQWQDYHDDLTENPTPRFLRIAEIIKDLGCDSVTELAGNAGAFSLMLQQRGICKRIICTDYDQMAVDKLYWQIKKRELKNISAAVVNMILPIVTTYGPGPSQRFKSDAVLALAVTHHLILSQLFKIDTIFSTIAGYSSRYVFIEFMPRGLYDGVNSTPVPDWYNIAWFRDHFIQHFDLVSEQQLEENRVLFVGKIK